MTSDFANIPSLSAFYLFSPARIPELVSLLDTSGYHRLWVTEHHARDQGASPTVLAAVAAGASTRLSIGTAGIMLQYQSPLIVAESFSLLEMFFPGRIDLGTIGGREHPEGKHQALLDGRSDAPQDYRRKFAKMVRFVRKLDPDELLGEPADWPITHAPTTPRIWICSLKRDSAITAANRSVGLVYNASIATTRSVEESGDIIRGYRERFIPCELMPRPRVAVVVYGCCEPTEDEASRTWQVVFPPELRGPVPFVVGWRNRLPIRFCGTPAQCKAQLIEIAHAFGADEVAVQCVGPSFSSTLAQYELLGRAFSLAP